MIAEMKISEIPSPPVSTLDDKTIEEIIRVKSTVKTAIDQMHVLLGNAVDSVQSLLDTLDKKLSLLDEKQQYILSLDEVMRSNNDNADCIIKLNLRGRVFETHKDNLLRMKGTFFHAMLSTGSWVPTRDGAYFIDRSPEGFMRILDYLSTGELSYEGLNKYEIQCLESNLDYFQIHYLQYTVLIFSIAFEFALKTGFN